MVDTVVDLLVKAPAALGGDGGGWLFADVFRPVRITPQVVEVADAPAARSYLVLIFSSLSKLAVMDSRTELLPLIHAPPSCSRDWRTPSVTVPESNTSVTTVASSPSGVRM
jgi:hypothetical protein